MKEQKFVELAKQYEKLSAELDKVREELTAAMLDVGIGNYVQDPETMAVYQVHKPRGSYVFYKDVDYKRTNIGEEKGGGGTVLSKKEAQGAGFIL